MPSSSPIADVFCSVTVAGEVLWNQICSTGPYCMVTILCIEHEHEYGARSLPCFSLLLQVKILFTSRWLTLLFFFWCFEWNEGSLCGLLLSQPDISVTRTLMVKQVAPTWFLSAIVKVYPIAPPRTSCRPTNQLSIV